MVYIDMRKTMLQESCEECEGRGIFYFTGEDSLYDSMVCGKCLYDSMVCGKCHGVGNYQVTEQSKTCINCGKDFFGCDEQCETCDIQDWRGY